MLKDILKSFAFGLASTVVLLIACTILVYSPLGFIVFPLMVAIIAPAALICGALTKGHGGAVWQTIELCLELLFGGVLFGFVFHLFRHLRRKMRGKGTF